jgi:hypothetical protein
MTLPGGPADKLGNRYEKLWTISEIVKMLMGFSDSIRIEDPAVQKAEFVVTRGGLHEFHQTKRVNQSGKWSLAALAAKDTALIQAIGSILSGNQNRFVFASGSDARELGELSESAGQAASFNEFQSAFLAADEKRELFNKLCGYWACDAATAYERLQRIEVRSIGEIDLEQKVRWGLQTLFLADPVDVLADLQKIVEDSVFRTIHRQELVDRLAQRGYALRRLLTPQNAGLAIRSATERYLDGVRKKLIRRSLVTREFANFLVSRLGPTAVEIVLTGKAGVGKTGCVIEAVDLLRAQGTPVLALRLDRLQSATSPKDLGVRLDLEESPVLVLAAAAAASGRCGVLIIDQLDAVSTMSGRASDTLDIVEELFLEARGVRARTPIHVVVVCRAFDLKNDSRLRQLIPDEQAQINVKEFSLDQTKAILLSAGFDPALFAQRQLELLQLPQNLSFFLEGGADPSKPPTFRTATELFDRYWDEKRRAVQARVAPVRTSGWRSWRRFAAKWALRSSYPYREKGSITFRRPIWSSWRPRASSHSTAAATVSGTRASSTTPSHACFSSVAIRSCPSWWRPSNICFGVHRFGRCWCTCATPTPFDTFLIYARCSSTHVSDRILRILRSHCWQP